MMKLLLFYSANHRKPFQRRTRRLPPAIAVRTFFVGAEGFPRTLRVAVDLPAAVALAVMSPVLDEAAHILRRIAQKQLDLVRERLEPLQAPHQLMETIRYLLLTHGQKKKPHGFFF
jgi:hypothetical protein